MKWGTVKNPFGFSKVKKIDWQGKKKTEEKTTGRKAGIEARELPEAAINVKTVIDDAINVPGSNRAISIDP